VDFARVVKIKPGDAHAHVLRWRESLGRRVSVGV
jgi:hypothetical protein